MPDTHINDIVKTISSLETLIIKALAGGKPYTTVENKNGHVVVTIEMGKAEFAPALSREQMVSYPDRAIELQNAINHAFGVKSGETERHSVAVIHSHYYDQGEPVSFKDLESEDITELRAHSKNIPTIVITVPDTHESVLNLHKALRAEVLKRSRKLEEAGDAAAQKLIETYIPVGERGMVMKEYTDGIAAKVNQLAVVYSSIRS